MKPHLETMSRLASASLFFFYGLSLPAHLLGLFRQSQGFFYDIPGAAEEGTFLCSLSHLFLVIAYILVIHTIRRQAVPEIKTPLLGPAERP